MCQGRMGGYMPFVLRQDGCLIDLCVKAGYVLVLLMCQGKIFGYITYLKGRIWGDMCEGRIGGHIT